MAPTLIIGEPLVFEEKPSFARRVGKVLALLLLFVGLACVTFWALGADEQQLDDMEPAEALGMMMQPKARQAVQPARKFLQPVQAGKSPIVGMIDMVVPVDDPNSKSPAELDIVMPVTKRDLVAAAAMALASMPLAASADEEALKAKICARTPTAKICGSGPLPPK
eukprot:gnl/TRDRNA2_/TRDRNA2_180498_c0_seq1.p2 gnl/TRDRNA2_/TRDRNA2_180498_c0~~gnl/TRDRNA2_/TRDRNA2_180498_c0_seq1.p2  ORF type:complete len:166 (-),score=44.12 gnl/TRDRNA2_/TRDRNA2_180498_c0_seq1:109-606(-)